jgi:hypothetical protein
MSLSLYLPDAIVFSGVSCPNFRRHEATPEGPNLNIQEPLWVLSRQVYVGEMP